MINKMHIKKFHSCKKYTPSNNEIQDLKDNIYGLMPLIKFLIEHYNVTNLYEMHHAIYEFSKSIRDTILPKGFIFSRLYEHQAIDAILKDPNIINKEYPNIKDIPDSHSMYTANATRSQKLVLVHALSELRETEKYINIMPISQLDFAGYDASVKSVFKTADKISKQKTIKDKILILLETQKIENEKYIKQLKS